jgi:adenylate cyclase
MKYFLITLYFIFSIYLNLNAAKDSLLVIWENRTLSDSIRIEAYNKYIWSNYINLNSDSSEFYIDKLYQYSITKDKKIKNFGLANVSMMQGVLNLIKGDYNEALVRFEKSLETSKDPLHKFNLAQSLYYIGITNYYKGDFNLAITELQETIKKYKELNKKEEIAATYVNLGSVYKELADYNKALEHYHGALRVFIKLERKEQISALYNNLGLIYLEKGEYVNALDYFDRSINIKTELGDEAGKASTFHNIGLIYIEFREYDKAKEYINKSIEIEKDSKNKRGLANSYVEMGDILIAQNKYDSALKYILQSLQINEEIGNKSGIAISLLSLGNIHNKLRNNSKANYYFKKSLEIFEEIDEKNGIANALSNLGISNIEEGLLKQALNYCTRAASIANELDNLQTKKLSCDCLYRAYKKTSQHSKALEQYEKFIEYSNQLSTIDASKDIQKIQFQKSKLADSLKQEKLRLKTKLEYENRISTENQQRNIAFAIGLILILVTGGLYSRNRYIRKTNDEIAKERDRSETLLLNILPAKIAKELKEKGKSTARDYENVTIMFTDFKEFTQASEKLTAHQLVDEINYCFEEFDKICEKYKIEKIKTIGDSYMAAGGLPVPFEESTKNTVLAAIEIQQFIIERAKERSNKNEICFEMRLGIYTGPVVAGIVGVKKFQYDIWGDTVNTASRMESAGEVMKVNIGQTTYNILKDDPDFIFEYRGKIQAKGKGEVDMNFVKSADKL